MDTKVISRPPAENAKLKPSMSDQTSIKLGELVHQLQLERGCTALYLDSEGELFNMQWRAQCSATDQAIRSMVDHLQQLKKNTTISSTIFNKTQTILDEANNLDKHRQSIDCFEIKFANAINYFTYRLLCPLLDLQVETALEIPKVDPIKVTAFANLLQWKERIGRERAWGAHGFFSGVFRNREFSERMLSLIEDQRAYRRAFLSLAPKEHKQRLDSVFSGYVMQCVEELHKMLEKPEISEDLEALSPVTWFRLLTGKIERLKLVENALLEDILPNQKPKSKPQNAFSATPGRLEKYMPLILALPAFSKLETSELDKLLSHADIRQVKKGQLLFLQSEPLSRMYLVLSGWVKLFKGSDGGDEAVLQMLSAGDSIMEASVFLDMPSAASAQAAEDTTLLTLPASLVRRTLSENRAFALNMVGSLSVRSQNLIRQIEHSRLRRASERTGWFLLKLAQEQSSLSATCIQFPFDKSLIASYLDMTPETFSRTLKKFKDRGFRIESQTITQPNSKALCDFCDQSLANACKYRGDDDCPGTYL